jgi:serine/threonine-protein kinase
VIKDPVVGDVIDQRYVLTREIARGGMGRVFEAEQRETGRSVALKIVHRRSRFVRVSEEQLLLEAQAIAAARHPGIVELLDVGVCAVNGPYLALEMLVGRTLDGIIASRRRLPLAEVVHIGRQMCEALAFCHERKIVHRDLKPSNVFVALEGGKEVVKLFDFGIAALGPGGDASVGQDAFGTPEYMAPEQLFGDGTVDHRVDVYAAGITLFECLTGEVPYPGTAAQVVAQLADRTRPVPRVRAVLGEVPVDIDEVLSMAIALDPERRFSSARALGRALGLASGLEEGSTCLLGEATPSMLEALDRSSRPSLPGASTADPRVQRLFERVPYVTLT